jgi:hypothetical protein
MAVPIFGLLALLSLARGLNVYPEKSQNSLGGGVPPPTVEGNPPSASFRLPLFFLAGLSAGLASLSHVYGLFWLPALALLLLWLGGRASLKPLALVGCGFALAWLPYLLFVASGWSDFQGQHLFNRSRATLADPNFYLNNLFHEPERYYAIIQSPKIRMGILLFLLGWPLSMLWLLYRALYFKDNSARVILVPLISLILGFALLISTKTYTYLATVWPLIALALASGLVSLWRLKPAPGWWQPFLGIILLVAVLEGGWAMVQFQGTAAQVTPYHRFTAQLSQSIPPGSRILAFQHYWLGLSHFKYRSMLAPIFLSSNQHTHVPISFYQALAETGANVIIVDEVMQRYLEGTASPRHIHHQNGFDFNRYLADHQAQVLARFRDPSYGRVTIYLIPEDSP